MVTSNDLKVPVIPPLFLTRGVPHYRDALFAGLHARCGMLVAAGTIDPARRPATFKMVDDRPWLRRFPFRWISRRHGLCHVPVAPILRETGADVVVAEFSALLSSTWTLALRRALLGRPRLIFWTHGYAAHRPGGRIIDAVLDRLRLWPLRRADMIACYTEESRTYLARFLPPERLAVIDNTIDVAPMRALRQRLPAPPPAPGPRLLAVGRMTADKRFPALVRVLGGVRRRHPAAVLTIIGDGPDMPAVRELAAALPPGAVELPGLIYEETQLAPYFLAADLFVFTGAVGLSVNHALAYGLPVVTFRRGPGAPPHHPEIAYVEEGVTGWLVSPPTEEAMVDALSRILADPCPPRQRLGAAIDRYVDEKLTMDGMVERFAELIQRVARR